ncbi:MAG: transposase [Ignavibacteria bacterium]
MQPLIPAVKKVEILREHLENDVPLSELAEKYHANVNSIMNGKKRLFESAVDVFANKRERTARDQRSELERLQKELQTKDAIIAQLAHENITLKKRSGKRYELPG